MSDEWHEDWEDKEKDLAEAERLKRTGLPFDEEILKKYGFGPKAYEWYYEPNVASLWMDENGQVIKNPDDYEISKEKGTKGMPVLKKK